MTESSPLLTSGSWFTPYNSDDDRSTGSENGVTARAVNDVTINKRHDDSSLDYHEYSIRVERSAPAGSKDVITEVFTVRWYLLFLFSMTVATQNAVWSTWGPIAESAKAVFGWDTTMLTVIINCGNLGVLLPVLFTGYLVSRKGIRVSMVLCTFLLALGSGLRTITTRPPTATVLIGLGQFCDGLAGSITQVIPPALSETWFPSNERTTATAVAVVANSLGSLVGFTLGPNIVPEVTNISTSLKNYTSLHRKETNHIAHQIWLLTIIEFSVAAALFILTFVYFPAKPRLPPSPTAAESRHDFTQGLHNVIRQPVILAMCVSTAVPWAVFGNWMGLVSENLHDIGISQHEAGLFGMYGSVAGILGGILIGRLTDKFPRRLKRFIVSLLFLALVCSTWITCMRNGYLPRSTVQFAVAITLMSTLMNGVLPLCYELVCEAGYPTHEGLISTTLSLFINIAAVTFLMIELVPHIGVVWMNWTLVGVFATANVAMVMLRERYSRSDVDNR